MLKRTSISLLFGIFLSVGVWAQRTAIYTDDYGSFQHALKLYNQHEYNGAQQLFKKLIDRTEDGELEAEAAFYDAMAAVHLQQHDAEQKMKSFVENYPESSKRNSAYSNVAKLYFQTGNYKAAGNWYDKVNRRKLSSAEMDEYNFNRGYIAFKSDDTATAQKYLDKVKDSEKFGSQAKYYLGYMAYEGENYQKAQELFDEVDASDRENKNVSYFQSNISFKSGDFQKAIIQAKEQLPKSNRAETSELNKIIGESYFNLEEYSEAIPYLEKYEGKKGRWNNTDYYQLGYAYYKQGDYEKAISQFNKIINGKDAVAQNAYYHLAESYIHLDKKQQALNAFKNASEMNYDADIQEDAALNYARLSYDIGNNYMSTPEVLSNFLEEYPRSKGRDEIRGLLVDSYVTSKNYKKAMELIEGSSDFGELEVYQKVAFLRGMELYGEEDYEGAKEAFKKSLERALDAEYQARATYWMAESNYNLQKYGLAMNEYREFNILPGADKTEEFKDLDYNLGYAYFNQQRYDKAGEHFKAYTQKSNVDPKQKNDAFVRLGDSYFVQSNYWQAMEEYNNAIGQKGMQNDYAYFQKAISYGFVDRNNRKIEELNSFINNYPKSLYRDDALYELGNTYLSEGQNDKAIAAYERIAKEVPGSNYISRAWMKQGLIYYNTNRNDEALKKFKKVATEYPNTEEANQAVTSARNIYVDTGKVEEYADWVKTLDYVNVTDSDIEEAAYESAENQLIGQNEPAAIQGFQNYIKKFPNGPHAVQANYHLGQLLYKREQYKDAEPNFLYVVEKPNSEFSEKSLENLARIYLELKKNDQAIPILKRLEKDANLQQNITFAQSNLMKLYYEQGDFTQTVAYAEKVLANDKAAQRARSDAQIFIARSAMKTGQEAKAKKAYADLLETAGGQLAAEAQYYDAYFKRKEGDYSASNQSIQVLAKDYSSYREYSVKGLLLMGKNFYDLKDAFQATYILQNIVDNFDDYPEVVEEAIQELNRIKAEEAKTNASIEE